MSDAFLLLAPVGLPFTSAAIALLLRNRHAIAEIWAGAAHIATLVAAFALFTRSIDGGRLAVTVFGNWPTGVALGFAARLPGTILVLTVALIAASCTIYARVDIGPRRRRAGYDALMLMLVGAVNGAFLTTDLFNLYVWFELGLVAALSLITIDRRWVQISGAIRYATFGMLGATAILLGISLVYGETGTLDLASLAAMLGNRPPTVATAIAAALLVAGFALKSGLAPQHMWLPASYAAAPLTVAAVFAALMTKMGFYALLLIVVGVFGSGAAHLLPAIGLSAAATMLLCSLATLAQADMRRLLGYHVVAQVGYMAAGLSLGTEKGVAAAIFYMVHSMIVQTTLFLGIGAVRRAGGSWKLHKVGGIVRSNPTFSALFAVPLLSLAGIPPLSGFWAKFFLIRGAFEAKERWIVIAALVAAILTIMSVATLWSESCWKSRPTLHEARRIPKAMLWSMVPLSGTTISIGLFPEFLWTVSRLAARTMMKLGI